jgi:hypothetical protein
MAPFTGRDASSIFVRVLQQSGKFGSIGFFLVSGFLMGEGLARSAPLDYMGRRLRRIFLPWVPWFVFCSIMQMTSELLTGQAHLSSSHANMVFVIRGFYWGMFATAYWFVPNLMLALAILLVFRRHLNDIRVGLVLLLISLSYGAILYVPWIPYKSHTQALVGFVFYLWLGAYCSPRRDAIDAWVARTSMMTFVLLTLFTGLLALGESQLIVGRDACMSTLRISNQIYSVAVVLMIFKMSRAIYPRRVNVRETTYGVHLSHSVVLLLILDSIRAVLWKFPVISKSLTSWEAAVGLVLGTFGAAYLLSLAFTSWMSKKPRLGWLVGASGGENRGRSGPQGPRSQGPRPPALAAELEQDSPAELSPALAAAPQEA